MECFIPVVKHRSEEEPEGYVVDNPAGYEFAGITQPQRKLYRKGG
jgi:hypothetical protein